MPEPRSRDALAAKAEMEIILTLERFGLTPSESLALLTRLAAVRANAVRRPPREP